MGNDRPGDRLRVLIALMYPYPGASPSANHMQRLALGLQSLGHDPIIVAPAPASQPGMESLDASGIRYTTFSVPHKPRWLPYYPHWARALRSRMWRGIAHRLESHPVDAVLTTGESGAIFGPVRRVCQERSVPVLPIPIEWTPPTMAGVLGLSWLDQELQRRFNYPRCDGIIGISRLWREVARGAGIPGIVVPSFSKFADDALPPLVHQKRTRFRLLFVGRWFRRELPATLFHGIALAMRQGVDVELVVVGSAGAATSRSQYLAEKTAIEALESLPQVRERISFLGFIPDSQLIHEMGAADALVLLREENRETRALFPTRLPEYLASGRPLIVSDAGDLTLYLRHQVSAFVIPPGDRPTELAAAIAYLATHPDEATAIGAGGRAALLESFSQTKLAARIVDFVRTFHRPSTTAIGASSPSESLKQLTSASE